MDLLGILFFAAGVIGLLLFLLSFKTKVDYVSGIIGVVFLLLFGRHELKTKIPFIDIRLFRYNPKLSLVFDAVMLPLHLFHFSMPMDYFHRING